MPSTNILTERQRAILRLLSREADLAQEFVLSGGTALAAFHLGHRRSDDLDLFTQRPVDALRIRRFMDECRQELKGTELQFSRLYDRYIFLMMFPDREELKVEFTQYPFAPLADPEVHDGVKVASLRDIAADKLAAMLDRFEPKDYYDLYMLLHGGATTLADVQSDSARKFHVKTDPLVLGSQLARGASLPVLPHMIHPVPKEELQRFFVDLARSLKDEVIGE